MTYADEFLEQKWSELGDVLVDEDEEGRLLLSDDWWIFDKGTERENIWHFFDEHHSKGVAWLMNCRSDEIKQTCDHCGEEDYESEVRLVPFQWKYGVPTEYKRICRFCVAELENNGCLTRCESCQELFFAKDLKVNPQNCIKEICPYCGEIWCE